MTGLARLLKGDRLSFGGGNGSFVQPPFWSNNEVSFSPAVGTKEQIESSFVGYVQKAYKANGIVFACITARQFPFQQALFRHQSMDNGEPGALSYSPALDILDTPWTNGTTASLLARMEQDASLSGNSYYTLKNGRLRRLRPDWTTIITGIAGQTDGSPFDLDAEVLGYIYDPKPAGTARRPDPVFLTPDVVAHYAPIPDPEAQWRGMSWLTPVLPEIKSDSATTKHKLKFFENGATSNFVVTYDPSLEPERFKEYVKLFDDAHRGSDKAYKTIHLGGGADAKSVGADLKALDFKATQGAGETRIAAAAGVGAIIGRFSEGMQGSSLNQGNFSAAMRQFGDLTLRPLWGSAAGALAKFAPPPAGSRLWYADKHIDFLQQDAKDAAEIYHQQAQSIRTLTDGGYEPESVIASVTSENADLLVHTGKLSVQLTDPNAAAATNGDT